MSRRLCHAAALGAALITAVALGGCDLGPDYKRPDTATPGDWREGDRDESAAWPAADWWREFGSAELNEMMATAQQTPPSTPQATATQTPGGTVKFSANTQLVIETVSVKDKNGKPIEGLTAKDFTVTEDGVQQTISFCEYQKLEEMVAPEPAATEPAPSIAAPPAAAAQPARHCAPATGRAVSPRTGSIAKASREKISLESETQP